MQNMKLYRDPGALQSLPASMLRYSYLEVIVASGLTYAMCCDACLDGVGRDITESVSSIEEAVALWEPRS
jgi:predicted small secreted protein